MIHYHGTPVTPMSVAMAVLPGRHAMVSFATTSHLPMIAEVCQSFALDNGAFTAWKSGEAFDFDGYNDFVDEWRQHPGFDWALIPDVIDGGEDQNDELLAKWPFGPFVGVPVWHMHESQERLERLIGEYPRVALGSSGQFSQPGTMNWWGRMALAMRTACDEEGRPKVKLHGLRMLNPAVFSHIPLSSADSTNVARNHNLSHKWQLPSESYAVIMAARIEKHASARLWSNSCGVQQNLELVG